MPRIFEAHFYLAITADEYERYYRGTAKNVLVTATNGQNIKFPANRLMPFLTREGIHGEFVLQFDENNKFINMMKVTN